MMKQGFTPLGKQSKRKQREFHAAKRKDWGGISPVTRKPPNPKAYNRKKSGRRDEHEPPAGFHLFYLKLNQIRYYPPGELVNPH